MCINRIFTDIVTAADRYKDNIAVQENQNVYTYAEILKLVKERAEKLQQLGIDDSSIVGLCRQRSVNLIIDMLALMKIGAVYVPIDAEYPSYRIKRIIEEAGCSKVIWDTGIETREKSKKRTEKDSCYILFTSGSSGVPKGVVSSCEGVYNVLKGGQKKIRIHAGDKILFKTSVSFAFSIYEIFWPLLNGACIVVVKPKEEKNPANLINYIEKYKIQVLTIVPSMLRMLNKQNKEKLKSLKKVLCAGEVLSQKVVNDFLHKYNCRLFNLYGMTEASGYICAYECHIQDEQATVPVGTVLENVAYKIIDETGKQVTEGESGEFCLGETTMFLKYHDGRNRNFLPKENDVRFWKTGDLVKEENGILYYRGRKDNLVKIRGNRVELEEVERMAEQIDSVEKAAAVCYGDTEKKIGLIITAQEENSQAKIRRELSERLPGYMQPSKIKVVESIPILHNGKKDRRSLLDLFRNLQGQKDTNLVRGVNDLQKYLLFIFDEALDENADMTHTFFELGGNSLGTIQILQAIYQVCGVELSVEEFMNNSSVEKLEVLIRQKRKEESLKEQTKQEEIGSVFPMTDIQRSYLFDRRMDDENTGIVTSGYKELQCINFDRESFLQALELLVKHHEVLRSVFHKNGIQEIMQDITIPVEEMDISDKKVSEEIISSRRKMIDSRLDFEKGPLFQVKILYTGKKEATIQLYFDAMLLDGMSIELILKDLNRLYNDNTVSLQKGHRHYGEYQRYLEERRKTAAYEKAKLFWEERRKILPENIELPTKEWKGRATGAQEYLEITQEDWKHIKALAKENGVTEFVVVLTLLGTSLRTLTRQKQFTICVPESDRPTNGEYENVAGVFSNFMLFAINTEENTLKEALVRNQRQLWELKKYHIFSGTENLREYGKQSGELGSGIMPVVFTSLLMESLPASLRKVYSESHSSNIPLEIILEEVDENIRISFNYVKEWLEQGYVKRLKEQMVHFVNLVAKNQQSINERLLISMPEEDKRIWEQVNHTEKRLHLEQINTRLAEAFETYKDFIALEDMERQVTYGELQQLVWQGCQCIKNAMKQSAVKKAPIGIYMKKGMEQIVAVLSCVYLGIPYVPIEEEAPIKRLLDACKNANVSILICSEEKKKEVAGEFAAILTEKELSEADAIPCKPEKTTKDSILTIIHTSGSTGNPKAVLVTQGGVLNSIVFTVEKFHITNKDAAIGLTNLAHDMAMFDIYGMLLYGGKLVLPTHEKRKDPIHWMELMKKAGVTIWNSVPAMMEMYKVAMEQNKFVSKVSLRLAIHGGDYLKPEVVSFIWKEFPACKVVNVGGPTETTLWNIYHEVTAKDVECGVIPYGRPIDNTKYYVMNKNLEEISFGVTGYLYASGAGITKGYLGDDEKTKEKYVLHPETGVRMYNTGDLGKYLPDGEIVFMGREDAQVKINGKRIEIEEIRNILQKHEGILDCNVIADIEKNQILAFYTANSDIDARELKEYMMMYLPLYMIPGQFMRLNAFPLTENGKIDRRRLLSMAKDSSLKNTKEEEQLTQEEQKMKALFDQVLGCTDYGKEESFLLAGGDSLKAIQLVQAISREYEIELGISQFFMHSSVKEITEFVKERKNDKEDIICCETSQDKWEPFGLSELQQAYLVGRKTEMDLGCISTHGYLEMECQDYDHEKLERVLRRLVKRHDMLRCVISYDGTQRFVKDIPEFSVPLTDLRGVSLEEQEAYMLSVREKMIQYQLDLESIPLVRVQTSLIGEKHAIVHIYFDTIIIDGYSYEILYDELEQLYEDENRKLPEIKVTFKDYIHYKEQLKNSAKYKRAKEYWMNRIASLPEAVTLPLLKNPDEIKEIQGVIKECKLSASRWLSLQQKARKRGITPFIILFTAFSEVLARWNSKKKFLLSIPEFDRPLFHEDIEHVVGECSTFLLFEVESHPEETFEETCIRNQKQLWEIKDNNSFSGMEVLREVYKYQNSYGSALVPIVFSSILDLPQAARKIFRTKYTETHTSQVWIDIDAQRCNDEIQFNWNCVKGLFDEAMLDDMVKLQMELLNKVADSEEMWNIPQEIALPDRDKRIIHRYALQERKIAAENIQTRIKEAFQAGGETIFLAVEEEQLSFRQVEERVLDKMHYMYEQGVRERDFVAVVLGKSVEQVVCTLAIVGLGAIYVPFEEEVPKKRFDGCMEHIGCQYAFIAEERKKELSENLHVLDEKKYEGKRGCYGNSSQEDLLTIIHTSGSTGNPKAVMVPQKGVINCIDDTLEHFNIGKRDAAIALTNLSHDMSMFDLFGMLFAGGKIVMPREKHVKDPVYWIQLIQKYQVTIWNSVPAMLQMLNQVLNQEHSKELGTIRRVFTGGDYIPAVMLGELKNKLPNAEMISVGGPTETTLWNIYHEVTEEDLKKGKIPYGRPISNNAYSIRDEHLREVPVGVTGVMYCTGVGVTKGYYNDEKTTKEKYILDEHGARMYCTGDLGRYLPNGEIEFMGRNDLQIKVNGKRIELNEIEHAMSEYPGVETAVAKVSDDKKQIYGYYMAKEEISTERMQQFLKDALPVYMIPKAFMKLEVLPLSRTNKIDRNALPTPHMNTKRRKGELSETEEKVLEIAKEILKQESIQIEDNFFLAGGDSLLAICFCKKLQDFFQNDYGLSELFENPQLSKLAELMEQKDKKQNSGISIGTYQGRTDMAQYQKEEIEYVGELSYAQEGIYLYDMFHDTSQFTLTGMCKIMGKLQEETLKAAIQDAIDKFDVLRTEYTTDDEFEPIAVVHKKGRLNYKKRIIDASQYEIELEKLKDKKLSLQDGMNLSEFELWEIGKEKYQLVVSLHHIISDQASFQILIKTIEDCYLKREQKIHKKSDEIKRFCDYAHWERKESDLEESRKFWSDYLKGVTISNIEGYKKMDYTSQSGKTVTISLTKEEICRMKEYFKQMGVTTYIGCFTLYTQFLHQITKDPCIAIGTPVSVRHFYEMGDTMGLFVNETVFVSRKCDNIKEAFAENRAGISNAIMHSKLPFEKVCELCAIEEKNLPFHFHFNFLEEQENGSVQELKIQSFEYVKDTMQHNFGLFVEIREEELVMQFTYKSTYLDTQTVQKLAEQFKVFIEREVN